MAKAKKPGATPVVPQKLVVRGIPATLFKRDHSVYLLDDGRFARYDAAGHQWVVKASLAAVLPKAKEKGLPVKVIRVWEPHYSEHGEGGTSAMNATEVRKSKRRWGPGCHELVSENGQHQNLTDAHYAYDAKVEAEFRAIQREIKALNKKHEAEFRPLAVRWKAAEKKLKPVTAENFESLQPKPAKE